MCVLRSYQHRTLNRNLNACPQRVHYPYSRSLPSNSSRSRVRREGLYHNGHTPTSIRIPARRPRRSLVPFQIWIHSAILVHKDPTDHRIAHSLSPFQTRSLSSLESEIPRLPVVHCFDYIMNVYQSSEPLLHKIESIKDEVLKLVSVETLLQDKIQQLESELNVFKKAYTDASSKETLLEEQCKQVKRDAERQKEAFEQQLQASRVVVLLDGDGAIFLPHLIARGQVGGQKAAIMLLEGIKEHMLSLGDNRQFQISVYIFFNRQGLTKTLGYCGHPAARVHFDDFVVGFNQATERLLMVDVGSDKEAADSKMRAFLDDEIRLPQTFKLVFGGCHDNGYVTTLRSHITSGFRNKFILLKSYSENAAGYHDLQLPVLSIPGLFITEKLTASPAQSFVPLPRQIPQFSDLQTRDTSPPSSGRSDPSQSPQKPGGRNVDTSPFVTYSRILSKQVERHPTTDSDTSSENNDDDISVTHNTGGTRRLNPSLPLSKQKPPPCTLFYLANNCKHGTKCIYAHDYILDADHYEEIKKNARKSPCPATNRDEICTWGDNCCYGHTCPSGVKCAYLKLGKCRFVGADMHREIKEPKN